MPRLLTATLLILLAAALGPADAQELIGLEVPPGRVSVDGQSELSLAARYRYVEINHEVTAGDRLTMNLFDDTQLTVSRTRVERHQGVKTWVGRTEGVEPGSVTISVHPTGIISALVEHNGKSFSITHKSDGVHAILEIDLQGLPSEGNDDAVIEDEVHNRDQTDSGVGYPNGAGKSAEIMTNPSVCLPASTCADKVLTVLVVYTQDAEVAMGGEASTLSWIATGITELNTVAANTGLGHSFELGLAREISYTESGDAGTDLTNLRYADGLLDEVHVWRDSVGADLVHLILDGGGCGIGNLTSDPTEYTSVRSYSASDDWCFRYNKTFPHELGHNLGLRHDRYVDPGTSPCGWAHGYVNQAAFGGSSNQRWRTVMAYGTQCSDAGFNCSRQAFYSNPENSLTGDPMGITIGQSDEADASYLLDRSMCVVAEYRPHVADSLQVAVFQEGYLGYTGAADTWLSSGAPGDSFGSDTELRSDGSPDYSALLRWDVSSIPSGATIVGALVSVSTTDASSAEHELYEVTRDWSEADATWNEVRNGVSWQTSGAQGVNDRGSTPLGVARSPYSGVLAIELNGDGIDLIQSWVDGAAPNQGLIMQDYFAASDGLYFDSKEVAEIGRRPRLTVWYETGQTIPTTLAASVILEGPTSGGAMTAALTDQLPTHQPYSISPWNYAGDDSVSTVDVGGVLGVPDYFEAATTIVDWVLVELREGVPPGQSVAARRAGFLHTDGNITDVDASSNLAFSGLSSTDYFVVVEHRNHAAVMSDAPVDFSSGMGVHDFTTQLSSGYMDGGDPMVEVSPGVFGLFAGDINADNLVTAGDFNLWLSATKAAETGYLATDVNLDGQVTAADFNLWLTNTKAGAASQVPD